jgi:hypothetical protein
MRRYNRVSSRRTNNFGCCCRERRQRVVVDVIVALRLLVVHACANKEEIHSLKPNADTTQYTALPDDDFATLVVDVDAALD